MSTSWHDRFWKKVYFHPSGCWLWIGAKDAGGYGLFNLDGTKRPHVILWESIHGPVPEGFELLHSCDHPSCINNLHLSVGTHTQNVRNSWLRGRRRRGKTDICYGCHERPKGKSNGYCLECQRKYHRAHPPVRKSYKRKKPFAELCSKCNLRPHRNGNAWCQLCTNEATRKWNRTKGGWKNMTPDQRQRAVARKYVNNRVKRGLMNRLPCVVCGDPKSQAHHHKGYSKEHAADVIWLCLPHHLEAERKNYRLTAPSHGAIRNTVGPCRMNRP